MRKKAEVINQQEDEDISTPKKLTKTKLIEQIVLQPFTPMEAVKLSRGGMVKRYGPDNMKDWAWDIEHLHFYEYEDLVEILDELKNRKTDGVEIRS